MILGVFLLVLLGVSAGIVYLGESGIGFVILLIAAPIIIYWLGSENRKLKNIEHTEVVNSTVLYGENTSPSGYSISSNGNFRVYHRIRQVPVGTLVEFKVFYTDGRPWEIVKAKSGTYKFETLASKIADKKEKISNNHSLNPIDVSATKNNTPLADAEPLDPPINTASKPSALDIPFEIMPNEFNLEVSYFNCLMTKENCDAVNCEVKFAIKYDGTVRGVRNRHIMCAFVNSEGKIQEIMPCFRNMDTSGCGLVEVKFWRNITSPPSKIIISIEKAT